MHKRASALIAVTAAVALLATACSNGEGDSTEAGGTITLDFETLVWQPGAVAANQEIVDAWNQANPDVQINLIRGAWKGMQDKMTTGFDAGKVPDVFHYDTQRIGAFAQNGNILDLDPYISDEQRADIAPGVWDTVQYDGIEGTRAIPFLQEADVVYANATMLEEAGIELPTMDKPWTWEQYRQIAKQLTVDANGDGNPEVYGAGVPLMGGALRIVRLSYGNDGVFFADKDGASQVQFGPAEQLVPQTFHDMILTDKSINPGDLGLDTEDMLPNFFAGKTATLLGESWLRDQLRDGSPEGFQWVLLPPIFGTSFNQPSAAQAIAVTQATKHPKEAAAFATFYTNPENQAKLAMGDGLIATSLTALATPELTTPEFGWDIVSGMGAYMSEAPFQEEPGFDEWTDRVADPAFDHYFRGDIDTKELTRLLVEDGNKIIASYNR